MSRTGYLTESDVTVLRNRLISGITVSVDMTQPPFVDALCLKEQVEE